MALQKLGLNFLKLSGGITVSGSLFRSFPHESAQPFFGHLCIAWSSSSIPVVARQEMHRHESALTRSFGDDAPPFDGFYRIVDGRSAGGVQNSVNLLEARRAG